MDIEAFDYHLPESLIAQTPLKTRDESRLLVLGRKTGNIVHKHFKNIIDYLEAGDTLVLNDTKVMQIVIKLFMQKHQDQLQLLQQDFILLMNYLNN